MAAKKKTAGDESEDKTIQKPGKHEKIWTKVATISNLAQTNCAVMEESWKPRNAQAWVLHGHSGIQI